ncbi:enoyl-CoA hydratase/isomerase family protein [uncultured Erythrobacter sp.]|uniref:enoyl-CoA hydratase/isomerase family protein n=1 Tax=uncultured Erythrobacter sp. TaxID=263913 RepID=UPI0026089F68|nr:enoyl-CoA hydratase/isomerase family protein [uncultured Erythrobacter sp.]
MNLRLEMNGPVAHLLIDRADKRNAFNMAMWEAMPNLLDQVERNPEAKVLVLRAADGGAFCAGADIRELLANKDDAAWRAANQAAINRVQYKLTRLDMPTLAWVEGDCVGGGCGLALACDLRLATKAARFGITPAKLGLVYPLHDVKLLTDLVGPGHARRMLYTGILHDAQEAQRIGLIEQIADSPDDAIAALLAASPHSIRESKRMIRFVLDGQSEENEETAEMFARAFTMPDFAEGTQAFVEKRKPEFGE